MEMSPKLLFVFSNSLTNFGSYSYSVANWNIRRMLWKMFLLETGGLWWSLDFCFLSCTARELGPRWYFGDQTLIVLKIEISVVLLYQEFQLSIEARTPLGVLFLFILILTAVHGNREDNWTVFYVALVP